MFSARPAIRVTHPVRPIHAIPREQAEGPVMANDGAGIGSPVQDEPTGAVDRAKSQDR
jgi:hypothetical protein